MITLHIRTLFGLMCACLSLACGEARVPFSLVSVEDEIAIGREAQTQMRADLRELTDAEVTGYVRSIGARLAEAASGPEYPYSFSVADAADINAFALPGGPVWVNRGIIQAAENESQLAGVIAHEVAHVAERHAAGQLTKGIVTNIGLALLGAILGNATGADAAQAAAGLLANGAFLKFSRDDEREADQVGLTLLHRAGWDGRGMIEMFEILRREGDRNPSAVETFFSSHPAPGDRIEGLRALVAESQSGTRDTREFRAVKIRLASLPAAPRQTR